ncbi:CopG family transcriptional regulator [Rhodohalobacter sp.]|uniref:ribbon-helix-helix domain-containing protein n=1 Tax=Rhodohalobacter sp. TaxID=1974210 RepID=UPI002ACEA98A|nr:CopG family transcriptional regulator [Rhodohalobacter sp.]MDZ7755785.1 CopG family transcriptional regulator [Rhodohalobacter sp.]
MSELILTLRAYTLLTYIIEAMKRTQIYISEKMKEELDALSQKRGISKSEIIREAVTEYISQHSEREKEMRLKTGAGLWKHKKDIPDLSKLRKEFERFS